MTKEDQDTWTKRKKCPLRCGCLLISYAGLSAELKHKVFYCHPFMADHLNLKLCPTCNCLVDYLGFHLSFDCDDNKAVDHMKNKRESKEIPKFKSLFQDDKDK